MNLKQKDPLTITIFSIFCLALVLHLLALLNIAFEIDFFEWAVDIQRAASFSAWVSINKAFLHVFVFLANIFVLLAIISNFKRYTKELFTFVVVMAVILIFSEVLFL